MPWLREQILEFDRRNFEEFIFSPEWRKSQSGYLFREYEGLTLTVFRRGDSFKWCIAEPDGEIDFSEHDFETEGEALQDLAEVFDIVGY